jgi:putative ABC transport system substrate-binding protein
MDRRAFISGATLALLAAPLAAEAQPPSRLPRIGILSIANGPATIQEVFQQELRTLGYVDAQSIALEWRWAEGQFDRLPALAGELVRLKVDVIVAPGEPAIRAASQATSTIPIVMAVIGDPVAAGFVKSLARPGANLTGLTNLGSGLGAKRLELLKEAVPRISRVAVLRNPTNQALGPLLWHESQAAAHVMGATLSMGGMQSATAGVRATAIRAAVTRNATGSLGGIRQVSIAVLRLSYLRAGGQRCVAESGLQSPRGTRNTRCTRGRSRRR